MRMFLQRRVFTIIYLYPAPLPPTAITRKSERRAEHMSVIA